ncbi:MAG: divergent polysaccharide deacetylase family protein [Desulfobacterales bacterium]
MAKPKTTRKKKTRRKSRKNKLFQSSLTKVFTGLSILVALVAIAGLLTHFLITPEKPSKPAAPAKSVPAAKKSSTQRPTFEIYPSKDVPPVKKPLKPPTPDKRLPLVAIIIDDLGYDKKIALKLSKLNARLTFSILPFSPFQKSIARLSREKGFGIMLHLPMEPLEYPNIDPGPGTLLTSMTPDQLTRQLEKDLDAVPYIRGVNNHMGSKMTAESGQMYQIFSILKKRGLYFVDSRTTAETLCKPSARLFQIPFAQRDIFLDHRVEVEFIRKQLKELVRIAQRNGYAVGIGHPHSLTYQVLHEMLPDLRKKIRLVPASEIVHPVS